MIFLKLLHNIYISLITFIICAFFFCYALFNYELSSVSNDYKKENVTIEQGSIKMIGDKLYKEKFTKFINRQLFKEDVVIYVPRIKKYIQSGKALKNAFSLLSNEVILLQF